MALVLPKKFSADSGTARGRVEPRVLAVDIGDFNAEVGNTVVATRTLRIARLRRRAGGSRSGDGRSDVIYRLDHEFWAWVEPERRALRSLRAAL